MVAVFYPPPVQTLLGLLSDKEALDVHSFALRQLNVLASHTWFEIADHLTELESCYEDSAEGECQRLTALLLSQIHFHLEQHQYALKYALLAGSEFLDLFHLTYELESPPSCQPSSTAQFVDMIVALAIDHFICSHSKHVDAALGAVVISRSSESFGKDLRITPPQANLMQDYSGGEIGPEIDESMLSAFVDIILSFKMSSSTATHGHPLNRVSVSSIRMLLGIALEACDIVRAEQVLRSQIDESFEILQYIVEHHELLIPTKSFRLQIFRLLASLYMQTLDSLLELGQSSGTREVPIEVLEELPHFTQVLFYLDDSTTVAKLLRALIVLSTSADVVDAYDHYLRALQLAFDLITFGSQAFLSRVRAHPCLEVPPPRSPPKDDTQTKEETAAAVVERPTEEKTDPSRPSEAKKTDEPLSPIGEKLQTLQRVLSGDIQFALYLKFSHQKNATDLEILDTVKNGLDSKHNVIHSSLIVAHGIMQRGTTSDVFLRKNLDWFARAVCWGKFSATASLGVVHQTHAEKSFRVLSTYLPGYNTSTNSSSNSSFSDGGSLYALGLIHANRSDANVISYLLGQLSSGSGLMSGGAEAASSANSTATVNEITQHGASLGLGLAAMGSASPALLEILRSVLMMDSAVSGQAAALGIGLIMIGSGNKEIIEDLLQYAKDTRHEKIIRACGLAVALILFRCEEDAAETIQEMLGDADGLLRYGGCFALGLAYCGTARESALRTLLHVAVSDASDDVRRASVLSISYVLSNASEQIPQVLKLLVDSFNFHVRFAALLAIGISCAGTASPDALSLVVAAVKDSSDIVRQAAYIALGFILMDCPEKYAEKLRQSQLEVVTTDAQQQAAKNKESNATTERARKNAKAAAEAGLPSMPTPSEVRDHLIAVSIDRRDEVMARVGAIIGLGLLEAGGRNHTASFFTSRGMLRHEAVVGFFLFSQYWFWYPLMHAVSLALQPTAIIGLTGNLKVPQSFSLECNAPASEFAYPKAYQPKKKETVVQSAFAVLSAAHRREGKNPAAAGIQETKPSTAFPSKPTEVAEPVPMDVEQESPTESEAAVRANESLATSVIPNMSRVVPFKRPLIKIPNESRYKPIFSKRQQHDGIVILVDSRPDEPESYLEGIDPPVEKPATTQVMEEEPTAPEPFELD